MFIGYRTLNWIVTALVAIFLVFVIGSLIYNYAENSNDFNRAKNNFNKLTARIDVIMETDLDKIVLYPPEGWVLRSDSDAKIVDNECFKKSCICICEDFACEDKNNRKCKGYDFYVNIESGLKLPVRGQVTLEELKNIMFLSSLEELRLIKGDEETVIIRRVE